MRLIFADKNQALIAFMVQWYVLRGTELLRIQPNLASILHGYTNVTF